ncbi:mating-type protein MAT alpha 1-domain-containing protein [Parachaetomium inaequale]|uniref:Mating-type protein MAT alpha 1-domain-containing protein n=1 Tax=Parachaetomium inaequale TaxID=2588326 RepID=A0AAN6P5T4_9PEZI|nr:mating-type protein MAT alpha 1-domain-containing protein [Parachaetomium inaequale]
MLCLGQQERASIIPPEPSKALPKKTSRLLSLSAMMRVENQRQPVKKKVNGFMGYRAYYSSLFSQLTQKEKSPIMTMLWKEDPSHKEWGFMCAVYSSIREFLSDENVSLQNWIQFAIKHMGIVVRESYLTTLGWKVVQLGKGTPKVERTTTRGVQSYLQPTNALELFMNCLNDGLPVANPLPIIATLSDLTNDIICVNTQVGAAAKPTNSIDSFCQPDKSQPYFTLPAHFEIAAAHPIIPQGVTVHRFLEISAFPAVAPFFMTGDGGSELNVMPERFLQDEGNDEIGSQANVGNQYFAMGMSNNTHGKYKLAVRNPDSNSIKSGPRPLAHPPFGPPKNPWHPPPYPIFHYKYCNQSS